ncbi:hypothetical protein AVV44_gp253 [Cronobacter phage S13]|jgi:hypothetical protein|uniref:Uncharacterized protein n=1 Tax=Cronobacter phage LPCS28 TaxID=2924885 RepID=A0AAE9K5C5_9CAUD|nr:hypothetical protein AVV44_gp253 [Cronobacter phage S13]YP_010665767.1 hypothetical protein PQB73_gp257 [Cronobacter phage LPCS28]AIA64985.1 hypothetical protein S13_188 [Cronobacter phage S13]UNY46956.1 hypothetical protein EHEKIMEA_00068 [Cronobacter phage LPCS28]
MAQITIEIPDHLVEEFLGYMSDGGGEQMYMEAYSMQDGRENKYVNFDYPGWKDKIVITECEE